MCHCIVSRLPIEVSFSAPEPREFIFHLQCNVKRKSTPINLNIKALGHSIDVGVSATNEKGDELMLLPRDGGTLRIIDFGKVIVNLQDTNCTYSVQCTCISPSML